MPLPNYQESNKQKEIRAYKRGKSDRRHGNDLSDNPFSYSTRDEEPELHQEWVIGWKTMDAQIKAGNIDPHVQEQNR